jgi:hypothetical protein
MLQFIAMFLTPHIHFPDKRKHEISRCRDFQSVKGYFGMSLLFIIDLLSFWLTASILLSWFMRSSWFFPTPNIPIRPAQLLTPQGGDAGALGKYGINVGPMLISWLLRYVNRHAENFVGGAMSAAREGQRRAEKDALKKLRKEERAREKEAKREAKRQMKKAKEEAMARRKETGEEEECEESSDGELSFCGMTPSNVSNYVPSFEDLDGVRGTAGTSSNFDDLD